MNILMYKGNFQYGVVNLFVEKVSHILKQKGHEVIILDLMEKEATNKLINIFSTKIIDCVIAFGAIGYNIKVNNTQSIYDAVNTTYLAIYIDHPVHLMERVIEPIKNYVISFVDKEHVDYVNEIQQQNHKISFFLPHGGLSNDDIFIDKLEEYKEMKEIDIVFSGTYMGDIKKTWEENSSLPNELIDKVCEKLIYDDYASIHKTFYEVFEEEGIKFSLIAKAQLSKLFIQIITYVRQYKRNILIERIAQSGLNITICGRNWNNFVSKYKNINYKGELNISETLELIKKSKVLINTTPNFTNGSHERVFTGMLNQTTLFSDKSKYYDKFFKDEDTILYYSFKTLDRDIERLREYLNDDEKLFNISQKAFYIAKEEHSWKNRVEKMLQMIALSKSMDI